MHGCVVVGGPSRVSRIHTHPPHLASKSVITTDTAQDPGSRGLSLKRKEHVKKQGKIRTKRQLAPQPFRHRARFGTEVHQTSRNRNPVVLFVLCFSLAGSLWPHSPTTWYTALGVACCLWCLSRKGGFVVVVVVAVVELRDTNTHTHARTCKGVRRGGALVCPTCRNLTPTRLDSIPWHVGVSYRCLWTPLDELSPRNPPPHQEGGFGLPPIWDSGAPVVSGFHMVTAVRARIGVTYSAHPGLFRHDRQLVKSEDQDMVWQ